MEIEADLYEVELENEILQAEEFVDDKEEVAEAGRDEDSTGKDDDERPIVTEIEERENCLGSIFSTVEEAELRRV